MSESTHVISSERLPWKFAEKHLDECTYTECKFCSTNQCLFGMRDVGCPVLEPWVLHQTDHVSSVVLAAYKAGFCEPWEIRQIREGIIQLITPIGRTNIRGK